MSEHVCDATDRACESTYLDPHVKVLEETHSLVRVRYRITVIAKRHGALARVKVVRHYCVAVAV